MTKQVTTSRQYHGMTKTRAYAIWQHMRGRCSNLMNRAYKNYGGRGITVCPSWQKRFMAFYRDMGEPPAGMTIERKKNNKGYSKANCIWATRKQQASNRRTNRHITIDGVTHTLTEWAELKGINPATLLKRIDKLGLSPEAALVAKALPRVLKTTRWIEYNGERLPFTAWAERLEITRAALVYRIKHWGLVRALETPFQQGKRMI